MTQRPMSRPTAQHDPDGEDARLLSPSAKDKGISKRPSCFARMARLSRRAIGMMAGLFLLFVFAAVKNDWPYRSWRFIITMTRPLWDKPPEFVKIHNYGWSGDPQVSCPLHGLTPVETPRRVVDIFPISSEWEMLEIRLFELDPVVDKFFIFEMPCYFNGEAKQYTFDMVINDKRYEKYRHKMVHIKVLDRECKDYRNNPKHSFYLEYALRTVLRNGKHYDLKKGDMAIFSDLDEIPRRETVELARNCQGWPFNRMPMQMKTYMYNFGLTRSEMIETAVIILFAGSITYQTEFYHGRGKRYVLTDAGWHCSWCTGSVEAIYFKMTGYSHNDRLRSRNDLRSGHIREAACTGEDPFGYDIEPRTWRDLRCQYGKIEPLIGNADVPKLLIKEPHRFRHFLPGGCKFLKEKELEVLHPIESPQDRSHNPPWNI